jgi:hypothetical protein
MRWIHGGLRRVYRVLLGVCKYISLLCKKTDRESFLVAFVDNIYAKSASTVPGLNENGWP